MHSSKVLLAVILLLAIGTAIAAPDPLLMFVTFAVLAFGSYLLWPVRDAPVLLLAFGQQWLSVALKPIETAITHRRLDDLNDFGGVLTPAVYFALIALTFFAIGMRLGCGGNRIDWTKTLALDAQRWPPSKLMTFSLALLLVGHALEIASNYAGGARQILLALGGARQAGLFILAYWCLLNNRAVWLLGLVLVGEIAFGLTGFFAGYRNTLLVFLVAAVTARPRIGVVSIVGVAVAVAAMLSVSTFWSAIKPEYRKFLNEGVGGQVAAQPLRDRATFIVDAARRMDDATLQTGVEALIARTSYVDFLAKTIEYVPAYQHHANGRQVGAALLHIITPRILFPDKAPTPLDTDVTAEYTGMRMTSDASASISIGYLGELYVDFGYIGGVVGSFALGALGGASLRFLRQNFAISPIVSYGLAVTTILQFSLFETALIKFLGGAVTALLGAIFLQRVVLPWLMPASRRRVLKAQAA